MILELVDIRILPDSHAAFETALAQGLNEIIAKAQGFHSYSVHKGVESEERYVLHILWNTLEDHTIGFRQSQEFVRWRTLVGPFFATPPLVEHFSKILESNM